MSITEQERFKRVLPLVLALEGDDKFTNDPHDPGGATRYGVTLATLQQVRPGADEGDVRALSLDEAGSIYRHMYWAAAGCDGLPPGVDYVIMDCAVNQGVGRAKRFLQRALGVEADGNIGPVTLAAAARRDPRQLIKDIRRLREDHYRALPTFPRYGRGWMRRLAEVEVQALAWAGAAATAGA